MKFDVRELRLHRFLLIFPSLWVSKKFSKTNSKAFFCQGVSVPRKVFIATDDRSVLEEAKERYPDYQIIGNLTSAIVASGKHHNLKSTGALEDIITDLMMMISVNFLGK